MSEHKQNFDDGVDEAGLLALADHVEKVAPGLFNQEAWGVERSCGMVCCLAGHAATINPRLRLVSEGTFSDHFELVLAGDPEESGTSAFAVAYGMPWGSAVRLTSSLNDWKPSDAAAALRCYVATRELPVAP